MMLLRQAGRCVALVWLGWLAAVSVSGAVCGDESQSTGSAQDGPAVDTQVFAGLLFIRQGRVGTRSEGPDYLLQTYRGDYLLEYKERQPWQPDAALEAVSRRMVGIRGTLAGDTIRVEQIQEIDSTRLPRPPLETLVEGNADFALQLLQQLVTAHQPQPQAAANVVVSPWSLSSALAMTCAGARGETAAEMARALQWQDTVPFLLHPAFADLRAELTANPRANFYTVHEANRLWGDVALLPEVLPEFREITGRHYGAELAPLDFRRDAGGARRTINEWIAEQTAGKIPELLPDGGVNADTRLVLTNALHFHGYWQSPFHPESTQPAAFHVSADQTVEVPMMRQLSRLPYVAEDTFRAVMLPVRGDTYSLICILPQVEDSLADVRARLSGRSFLRLARRLQPTSVELFLPRFVVRSSFELRPVLSALGMPSAFASGAADFSGINGQKDLLIDKVFHEAVVDVNETGVEAAAATGVVMSRTAALTAEAVLRFDRPFLFAVYHNRTGSIVFLGQVVRPEP